MARCCHLEGSPAHGTLVASDHPAGDGRLAEVVTYEGLLLSALQEVLRLHGYVPGQRGHITRGGGWSVVPQKVASELHPKVCNQGEGPY